MSLNRSAFAKWAFSAVVAAVALSAAAVANAEVSWSIGNGAPIYYEPAPVYSSPPPVYYEPEPPVYYRPPPPTYYRPPPPVYYRPPPAYYEPPPQVYYDEPDYWQGSPSAGQPKLSRMQQRALDNCVVLAPRDQPRCRATVLSTVR